MGTRAWQFAGGRVWPVDAQEAGDELDRIREANGGELRPEAVLSEARSESSLLHPCFEWDDSRAAEKYRREQAASLIRSVRVLVVSEDGEKEPARAYIRVLPAGADKPAYLPRAVVAAEPSLLSQAINEAVSDLRHAENRLAEFRALRKELSDLKQIRLRLEARPEAQA